MTPKERAERERLGLLAKHTEQLRNALRWRGEEYSRHRRTGRHLDGWYSEVRKARTAIEYIRALRLPPDGAEVAERQASTMRIVDAVREALGGDTSPDDTSIQGKAARILRERDQARAALDEARRERDEAREKHGALHTINIGIGRDNTNLRERVQAMDRERDHALAGERAEVARVRGERAADVRVLEDVNRVLRKRARDAEAEAEDTDAVCDRMRSILERVAIALRGPAPENGSWGWADLGERAELATRERDEAMRLLAKVGADLIAERDAERERADIGHRDIAARAEESRALAERMMRERDEARRQLAHAAATIDDAIDALPDDVPDGPDGPLGLVESVRAVAVSRDAARDAHCALLDALMSSSDEVRREGVAKAMREREGWGR